MGNYLNPGNDMFYKMVHSEIYVDKTGLIGYCNHVIIQSHSLSSFCRFIF